MSEVFEYRGIDNLMIAEVTGDDNETEGGYKTSAPKLFAPVAEIGKTTETSSEAKYYDNLPKIIVNSTGADEVKITTSVLPLEIYAMITGQYFDAETGMLVEGAQEPKYFAIGYRTKGTDGKYRYVWRLKGTFSIPDETVPTENDGTDSNNMELTFTGISTTHVFNKNNGPAKSIVVDERYGKAELDEFFKKVNTPDTIEAITE